MSKSESDKERARLMNGVDINQERNEQDENRRTIGSCVSEFTVMKELGRGSYGVVYKVQSNLNKKEYVMKKINIKHMDAKHQKEALKEAQILRKVRHENVIRYYTSFVEHDCLYIIMEYADGGDLHQLLRYRRDKKQSFLESEIWEYASDLIKAVDFLHKNNIIHRDIKTLNIFLTKERKVKLGDLGVSKIVSSQAALEGTRVGTPLYLAPELVKQQPYDFKVDIWAIGIALYHISALEPPFQGENLIALGFSIVHKLPKALPSQYSPRLVGFINKLLEKNPLSRPTTDELLESFQKKTLERPQTSNGTSSNSQSKQPTRQSSGLFGDRIAIFDRNSLKLLNQAPDSPKEQEQKNEPSSRPNAARRPQTGVPYIRDKKPVTELISNEYHNINVKLKHSNNNNTDTDDEEDNTAQMNRNQLKQQKNAVNNKLNKPAEDNNNKRGSLLNIAPSNVSSSSKVLNSATKDLVISKPEFDLKSPPHSKNSSVPNYFSPQILKQQQQQPDTVQEKYEPLIHKASKSVINESISALQQSNDLQIKESSNQKQKGDENKIPKESSRPKTAFPSKKPMLSNKKNASQESIDQIVEEQNIVGTSSGAGSKVSTELRGQNPLAPYINIGKSVVDNTNTANNFKIRPFSAQPKPNSASSGSILTSNRGIQQEYSKIDKLPIATRDTVQQIHEQIHAKSSLISPSEDSKFSQIMKEFKQEAKSIREAPSTKQLQLASKNQPLGNSNSQNEQGNAISKKVSEHHQAEGASRPQSAISSKGKNTGSEKVFNQFNNRYVMQAVPISGFNNPFSSVGSTSNTSNSNSHKQIVNNFIKNSIGKMSNNYIVEHKPQVKVEKKSQVTDADKNSFFYRIEGTSKETYDEGNQLPQKTSKIQEEKYEMMKVKSATSQNFYQSNATSAGGMMSGGGTILNTVNEKEGFNRSKVLVLNNQRPQTGNIRKKYTIKDLTGDQKPI